MPINLCAMCWSSEKSNVALLRNIVKKKDDLLDSMEDMENIEFFFRSQRDIFDDAMDQVAQLAKERDYLIGNTDAENAYLAMSRILSMPKPYNKIGELPELISKIKAVYNEILELRREDVLEHIRRCMQDVHQLAEEARDSSSLLRFADEYFSDKRKTASEAKSITELDAMITQVLNQRDVICRRMEALAADETEPTTEISGDKQKKRKITSVRRYDMCAAKRLLSSEDIDMYVEGIREKLMKILEGCDEIQIN